MGYVRNELTQTAKSKRYRLLNVDRSGVSQTKNYWNHHNDNQTEIEQGSELFLVLKKQWIRGVQKYVYQWIPTIGYPILSDQIKEHVLYVGSVLENKDIHYNDDKKLVHVFF